MTYTTEYSEETSHNWSSDPEINTLFLRNVMNYLKDRLASQGHLFLNEVHKELNLPVTLDGQFVGWRHTEGRDLLWTEVPEEEGRITLNFLIDGLILEELTN